jgi:hypothetical protein
MIGVINQPNAPIFPLELTNKLYVDSLIASGVPDATTTSKGKIKLSGDSKDRLLLLKMQLIFLLVLD